MTQMFFDRFVRLTIRYIFYFQYWSNLLSMNYPTLTVQDILYSLVLMPLVTGKKCSNEGQVTDCILFFHQKGLNY